MRSVETATYEYHDSFANSHKFYRGVVSKQGDYYLGKVEFGRIGPNGETHDRGSSKTYRTSLSFREAVVAVNNLIQQKRDKGYVMELPGASFISIQVCEEVFNGDSTSDLESWFENVG